MMETCVHGKELWARCEDCEAMTPPPPVDSSGNRLNEGEPKESLIAPEPVKPYGSSKQPNAGEPVALSTFEKYLLLSGINLARYQHDDDLLDTLDNLFNELTQSERDRSRAICPYLDTCKFEAQDTHPQPNAGVVTDAMVDAAESATIGQGIGGSRTRTRTALEAALSAAPKPECTIVHSEDPSAPAYLALGAVKVTRERCG